jgi:VanZ family protein
MQWGSMTLNSAKIANGDAWGKKWPVILMLFLFPLFFFGGPDYYSSRSFKNFWNVGHVVFFALFSYQLLIDGRLFRNKSFFQKLFLCLFISTILGIFIEFAQNGFDRDVEINDLWRDLLGASIGFFLSPLALNKLTKTIILFSLTAVLMLQSIPWFLVLADEINANLTFPVLSDFESEVEATRWSGDALLTISDEMAFSGDHSLRVDLGTEKYSGIALRYFPKDWSEYQILLFEVFNTDDNLDITVRIHDQLHTQGEQLYSDRFNRKLTLHKGWNTININLADVASAPVTRRMDLSSVGGLGVFVVEQSVAKRIYLDAVKLVKIDNASLKPDKSTNNRRRDL